MFEKYEPMRSVLRENWGAISARIVGNLEIGIFFFTIGTIILIFAGKGGNKNVSIFVGLCFLFCSLSRFFSVYNTWYGYYGITSLFDIFTGLVAMVATTLIVIQVAKYRRLSSVVHLYERVKILEEKLRYLEQLKTENTTTNVYNPTSHLPGGNT